MVVGGAVAGVVAVGLVGVTGAVGGGIVGGVEMVDAAVTTGAKGAIVVAAVSSSELHAASPANASAVRTV